MKKRSTALNELVRLAEEREKELAAQLAEQRAEEARARVLAGQWVAPMTSYSITATFGQSSYLWSTVHTGVDLDGSTGDPVGSVAAGVVSYAGYDGSYGNKVAVTHTDGTETWYAHLDAIAVNVGEQVTPGQLVGTVGATGNVTGSHLHLEVRPGGQSPVDPVAALAERGVYL